MKTQYSEGSPRQGFQMSNVVSKKLKEAGIQAIEAIGE